ARKTRVMMHGLMAGLALVAIIAYAPLMRAVFPGRGFEAGAVAFALLLIGVVFQSGFAPMGGILFQGGRPGMQTLLMLIVVLTNLTLNLILVPRFDINGAAGATMVAYILKGVLIVVFARQCFNVRLWR
ncbi:MAG TPA: polysaccharide biosynthesis C-terminal domain-containing protein, partial [Phycisphaerae bacterium]|nr:polysaccharide biosynthesis C-terminal domain-containing protein [Phycisphaerae bacterium]